VLVADELTPSVVAQLDWTRIRGFATDAGSRTYHTAILARSLGVPAVVGLHDVSRRIPPGARSVIDGDTGEITIDPTPAMRQDAESRARLSRLEAPTDGAGDGPNETRDGVRIQLQPTSSDPRMWQRRWRQAPKASACIDPNSCSPAVRPTWRAKTSSTTSTNDSCRVWRRDR
jgi:phosphoenolpyruvate-protein kinase (PTS system EI component)